MIDRRIDYVPALRVPVELCEGLNVFHDDFLEYRDTHVYAGNLEVVGHYSTELKFPIPPDEIPTIQEMDTGIRRIWKDESHTYTPGGHAHWLRQAPDEAMADGFPPREENWKKQDIEGTQRAVQEADSRAAKKHGRLRSNLDQEQVLSFVHHDLDAALPFLLWQKLFTVVDDFSHFLIRPVKGYEGYRVSKRDVVAGLAKFEAAP